MHVIVSGAGIAGLSAAATLRHVGAEVTVVEQAHAIEEIGAGIQLSANGMAVLSRLGLEEPLAACAIRPESLDFIDLENGEFLVRVLLGDLHAERYGGRFYQVHRADLVGVLAGAVPAEVLRLGARVVRVEQDEEGVQVGLASGEVLRGDALIAADGIHSTVRAQMHGPEDPTFGGLLCWRALIPAERLAALDLERRCYGWIGPGRTIVSYWVRGGELFNFLGTVPATEVRRESWTESGDVADLRASFAGGEPRVAALMETIDSAFITGLYYRDPLPRWTEGRVALLGEAAHAMTPFLAQGACQGMEDAWMLAQCVARHGERAIPAALAEYEQRRRPRTIKVQAAARAMVAQLHEPDARQIRARNGRWKGMARIDPLNETVWGWLYAYDPTLEVDRPLEQVVGLTPSFAGKRMVRPQAQRAFEQWRSAFTSEDVARGIAGLREGYERFTADAFPLPAAIRAEAAEVGGVPGRWITPAGEPSDAVLLHCHGGGYILGSASSSAALAGRLAETVGARALALDYRLAPEDPFPAALQDVLAAYRALLARGVPARRILLSGDSAGGGLAVAAALALRDAGEALPAGVVALSPFADLTVSGPSVDALAGHDPIVSRELLVLFAGSYFQGHDPADPAVSPLYGDFAGMPPLLITAAREELLVSDATRLAERARAGGAEVTLELAEDSVHVFPLFEFLPETATALRSLAAFAQRVGIS
jgi:salicylate hydroxylase